ncbi:MAG: YcgN family cysteine cluster protein [Deltaproteobacteria bacterium]|nr:YcgN family cysteine cluster protein [Deltaproteobacteria bacterium]
MSNDQSPFWKIKLLEEMTPHEWELLCDGCGRCCMIKLEDEETRQVYYTNVACKLLNTRTCRCLAYHDRKQVEPACLALNPKKARELQWLPGTCAYRLLAEGRDLLWWHPLVSGDPDTVHLAGISVRGKVVSECYIHPDQLTEHIIDDWILTDL